MSKDSAVVDSTERAYDLSARGEHWLADVINHLRPAVDSGLGIFGWLYDARDFRNLVFTDPVFLDIPKDLPAALVACSQDPDTPLALTQMHYRTPAGPFSASLGTHFANYRPWKKYVFPVGVKDLLVVNGVDANRRGCAISAPRRNITRISPARQALLEHLSVHLATAHRLRRRIEAVSGERPGPAHPRVEAVLSSSGKLEHASSTGRSREAGQALSLAVRAAERARGKLRRTHPDEAMKLWKSMVSGRWTLSDHFESDGRRYILAYVNPPVAPPVRSLSELERQVLSCAALGKSNKLIAHELGITMPTVGSALKRAAAKLGAIRPRDLVAIMDRVLVAPVSEQP
ncbi:MAG: LuxR C-terminal-related transcriptional regulator [Polyangiaceae bacterium]